MACNKPSKEVKDLDNKKIENNEKEKKLKRKLKEKTLIRISQAHLRFSLVWLVLR